jgi:molybdate transport system substrate-binding protein
MRSASGFSSAIGWPGRMWIAVALAFGLAPALLPFHAKDPLLISVAVSLKPAIQEAVDRFSIQDPELEAQIHSGASGILLQQVRRHAPVDLFLSASPVEIETLRREGRILGEPVAIAGNRLVIIVPRSETPPARLEELESSDYPRIAVGNPRTAPIGRYTREALESAGLWQPLQGRFVMAENARQILDYVARGEVAAGIVYHTDAALMRDRVRPGLTLSLETHLPIRYEGAVIGGTQHPELAARFLRFLVSEDGQAVFRRHGFR